MKKKQKKIERCPFCGRKAKVVRFLMGIRKCVRVCCLSSRCSVNPMSGTTGVENLDLLIKSWNKRADEEIIVSARMWEKAAKENKKELQFAMITFMPDVLRTMDYFLFEATPAEKLICAIAAMEEK